MAQILVRNLEEQLKDRLKTRARRHRRSMEEEAREILREALREPEQPRGGLGSEMVALFSRSGVYIDEPIAEIRGMRMEIPDFES